MVIESPYGSSSSLEMDQNISYACACMKDCFSRGEYPYASHLLYTQEGVLDDNDYKERRLGMSGGFAWGEKADKCVVYIDRGISEGMREGIARAEDNCIEVEYRHLDPEPA